MKKGFTLVEMLLVVVIIAILTAIVLVAISPARQIAQANNTKRRADVTTLLNAISEFIVDNGVLPTSQESILNNVEKNMSIGAGNVDICDEIVPKYIAELPFDPTNTNAYFTSCNDYNLEYNIKLDQFDRVTIIAPDAQLGEDIEVSR